MSLSVALKVVNGMLSEYYCPIDSFRQIANNERTCSRAPHMGMSKGESLMAELLYLRVETQSLQQKNRRLKRQLFSHFLPRPKKYNIDRIPQLPGTTPSPHRPGRPPLQPCRLPPIGAGNRQLSRHKKLPPVRKVLSDIPQFSQFRQDGCKFPRATEPARPHMVLRKKRASS